MQRVTRDANGTLYLTGGSNEVLHLYTAAGFAAAVDLDAWRTRLAARTAWFAAAGISWCQLLAPEKLSVTGDALLHAAIGPHAQPPGERLCGHLAHPALVYPRAWLRRQHAAGHAVYPRTDSHWTPVGAFAAFQWALPHLGITVDFAPYLALAGLPMTYRGDLWEPGMDDIGPERFERKRVPDSIVRTHANAIVATKERLGLENDAGLHVGSHVVYRNPAAERPERLVLFGSSFSDHRAECGLLTFLAALFFREVHFIWSSDLDLALIASIAPNLALLEMPERFLTLCPTDQFNLTAHTHDTLARRGYASPAPT